MLYDSLNFCLSYKVTVEKKEIAQRIFSKGNYAFMPFFSALQLSLGWGDHG